MRWLGCLLVVILCAVSLLDAQESAAPFVEGSVDNLAPYIGEPVIYTLRIYTPEAIEDSTVIEPSFFGFGRSDITFEPSTTTETIDGQTYSVIEQRHVLYPLRAGETIIDPFEITIPETPFSAATTITTNALTVDVQTFPEPVPDTFINAVGQFTLSAAASPTQLTQGEAFTLSVTVTGSGNLEQLLAPLIDLPEGWRLFDGETELTQQGLGVGSKLFSWTIIADGSGNVTIPAIVMSSFDPQTESFVTSETAPIILSIAASQASDAPVVRTLVPLPTVYVPELRTATVTENPLPIVPPLWFWALWAMPPLLIFGVWIGRRPREDKGYTSDPTQTKKPRKQNLAGIREQLQALQSEDPKYAYTKIGDLLLDYISAKMGTSVTAGTLDGAILTLPDALQAEIHACIEETQAGQYAPVTREDVRELSRRVLRVCLAIEKVRS